MCIRDRHEIVKEIPEVDAVVGLGSNAAICSILERLTGTQPVESYGAVSYTHLDVYKRQV